MNATKFLSACLMSLSMLACHDEAAAPESCLEESMVIQPHIPPVAEAASAPASAPAAVLVEPAPKAAPTQQESELRLVISPAKRPMIALQEVSETRLAKGKSAWVSRSGVLAVRRDVESAMLPEATTAWVGQAVKLYKADGSFCEANVTGLALLGQIQTYNDNPDKGSASKMFTLSQERGGVRLVAELDVEVCEGARFARVASLPDPKIVSPAPADKALRQKALTAMRTLPAYQAVQARYKQYKIEQEPLTSSRWEYAYDEKPKVLTLQTEERALVLATAQQDPSCGGFYGDLFALWEVKSDGSLALLFQGEGSFVPDFALDTNGDQTLEFFQSFPNESWRQLEEGQYKLVDELHVPFQEDVCGC